MTRRRERGFTFVEIMIALSVGAIIIAGMFEVFDMLQKWWNAAGVTADQRENARVGLEMVTRDLEMAGFQTTNFDDPINKAGLAVTKAEAHAIEVDQQRPATSHQVKDYVPRLVHYSLKTDQRTKRQNLYRQVRTEPGLQSADELIAENVSEFTLEYFDKFNGAVACLGASYNHSHYTKNLARPVAAEYCQASVPAGLSPDPLKNIRRIKVTLTTIPARSTSLTAAAAPGVSTLTVVGTEEFPASGKAVVFLTNAGGRVVDQRTVSYTGKTATQLTGVTGLDFDAALASAGVGAVVARPMPIGPAPKPFTLTASVQPRNLEAVEETAAGAAEDTVPPETPTGLAVIDNRSCTDKLQVRWNHNTEADLAGYRIFYGPAAYVDVGVDSVKGMTKPEVTLRTEDLLITKSEVRNTAPNTYSIQILAYDSADNRSEKSAPVSANPTSDVTSFTSGANDTTINPAPPAPPEAVTVAEGATGAGELVVSWTAADGATAGYRLYRSTAPFPSGLHIDGSVRIADETTLFPRVTSFTDTNLVACTQYTYAVASVNCDETLIPGYHYNGSVASDSSYTVASGEWRETVAPPTPALSAAGSAARQAYLTLTNPTEEECPDLERTEVYWSKFLQTDPPTDPVPAPHLDGSVVSGGSLIPNSDSGSAGVFRRRGSQVIDFDREAAGDAALSLAEGYIYSFLAVSYDRCGNVSGEASASVTVPAAATCTDDPPCPPPAPTRTGGSQVYSCRQESVVVDWEYGTRDADFSGFRVWRRNYGDTGKGVQLTSGPISQTTWTDTGVADGTKYVYSIEATDCVYEQYLRDTSLLWPYDTTCPTATLSNTPNALEVTFSPGTLQRYRTEIARNVAHTAAAVAYGDTTIPVRDSAALGFAASGQVSVGCHRVNYSGTSATGFTGCTWPASAAGYAAPENTQVHQYDWTGYSARENFVISLSDAMAWFDLATHTPSTGSLASYLPSTYTYHNNVKLWVENTSQDPLKITRMKVAWTNPDSFRLEAAAIGGSPSAMTTAWASPSLGGLASGDAFSVGATLPGRTGTTSDAIQLLLRFTNPDGTVNRLTDLRGDVLKVTLWRGGNGGPDTECSSPAEFTVVVPRGPDLRFFTQSAPGRDGINSYAVPGEGGTARDTDMQVSSGIRVAVSGYALDNSREVAPDGCNLGWIDLDADSTRDFPALLYAEKDAEADTAAVPTMPATATQYLMAQDSTVKDLYTIAEMPRQPSKVHWYYALAMDRAGNWDRTPVFEYGSYAYFQKPFDVCNYKPMPPVLTLQLSTQTDSGVLLTWHAPTAYADGTPVAPDDVLLYDVYYKNGSGAIADSDLKVSGLSSRRYYHAQNLAGSTNKWSYAIKARNACATPNPAVGYNTSGLSNTVSETRP